MVGGGEKSPLYTAVTQGFRQAHPELHLPEEQNQSLINVCVGWVGEGVERLAVKESSQLLTLNKQNNSKKWMSVSRVAIICHWICPVSNKKNYEVCNETGKYDPYTRKKQNKTANSNCVWEHQMLDLTEKDFKIATINMFTELKESVIKEVKEGMLH